MKRPLIIALTVVALGVPAGADEPTGSLMARLLHQRRLAASRPDAQAVHALQNGSLFAVAPPEERVFNRHDLVQIIVRESSRAISSQDIDTEKDYRLGGEISAWPHLRLEDLLQLQLKAGDRDDLPAVGIDFRRDFEGDGDYERRDDLTARLTAEVIEVMPNGNLVLEARTEIYVDEEGSVMKVTGVCRPEDVSAANNVLSTQLHDLKIQKLHSGELKKTTQKGILSRIFDTIFAF